MFEFTFIWSKTNLPTYDALNENRFRKVKKGDFYLLFYDDSSINKKIHVFRKQKIIYFVVSKIYFKKPENWDTVFNSNVDLFEWRSNFYLALKIDLIKKCFRLFNDPFGQINLYYTYFNNVYLFSTDMHFLLNCGIDLKLNEYAFFNFLNFCSTIGNSTLFNGIYQLENATEIRFNEKKLTADKCWKSRIKPNYTILDEKSINNYFELIKNTIRKTAYTFDRVGVALSGGLDSRLITGVLAQYPIKLKTYTSTINKEEKIAGKIAHISSADHKVFNFTYNDYCEHIPTYISLTSGHVHLNQFWILRLFHLISEEANSPDIIYLGYLFDILFNCWHSPTIPDNRGLKKEEFLNVMRQKYPVPKHAFLSLIFNPGALKKLNENFEETLVTYFEQSTEFGIFEKMQNFYIENRGRKYTSPGFNNFLEVILPGVEPEIFNIGMQIPLEERFYGNFYRKLFIHNLPQYAKVRYPRLRSNLINADSFINKFKYKIAKDTRYEIRKLTKGKIIVDGRVGNDYLFRHNRQFRTYYVEMLMNTELSNRGYLSDNASETITNLIDKGFNLMEFVQSVLTMDLFIKKYLS